MTDGLRPAIGADSQWTGRRGVKRVLGLLTTMLLFLMLGGSALAQAAPPFAQEARIDSIEFVTSQVQNRGFAELKAKWSLPDSPSTPAGFTLSLPDPLVGRGETFSLIAEDTHQPMAECVVTADLLTCEFDSDYLASHPKNLRGDVFFWVRVDVEVEESVETSFDIENHEVTITVTPGRDCGDDCELEWKNHKGGNIDYQNNRIIWWVHVKAGPEGMAGGERVVIRESPSSNLTLVHDEASPNLMRTQETSANASGNVVPVNWQSVPRSEYSVDAEGTVEFTSERGYFYQLSFVTTMNDGGVNGSEYSNTVEITIGNEEPVEVSNTVRYSGGGGSGIGEDVGVFSVRKSVEGLPIELVEGVQFVGEYTVTDPEGAVHRGTFEVEANGVWTSPEFPRGSRVNLAEILPTQPANVDWREPEFSQNDFTLVGGQLTEIIMTNTGGLKQGSFSVAKDLAGTTSAVDRVPGDAVFVIDYSYPAGAGFPAGSGSIEVAADGTPVRSPAIPYGAEVRLVERAPAELPGMAWGDAQIVPDSFTVDGSTAVAVKVTNPITHVLGGFSLKKSVSGPGSGLIPEGFRFEVDYAWQLPGGGESGSGTVELGVDGAPVVVDKIPVGAVVTLTEHEPGAVAGVDWLDPRFSENGFVILPDAIIEVDLDNPADLGRGAIALRKVVAGSGAKLVPADTEFEVNYSYAAGTGFPAGEGVLTVRADGKTVQSSPIPHGAVLTLSELRPKGISGVNWTGGRFDVETVHVVDGDVAEVVLTNTFERAPVLAETGADGLPVLWGGLGAALLAGGLLILARRRAQADSL